MLLRQSLVETVGIPYKEHSGLRGKGLSDCIVWYRMRITSNGRWYRTLLQRLKVEEVALRLQVASGGCQPSALRSRCWEKLIQYTITIVFVYTNVLQDNMQNAKSSTVEYIFTGRYVHEGKKTGLKILLNSYNLSIWIEIRNVIRVYSKAALQLCLAYR